MAKSFYIHAKTAGDDGDLAEPLQIVIPEGHSYEEAFDFAYERISDELDRYFLRETLIDLGFKTEE